MNVKFWVIIPFRMNIGKTLAKVLVKLPQLLPAIVACYVPTLEAQPLTSANYAPLIQIYDQPTPLAYAGHNSERLLKITSQLISLSTTTHRGNESITQDGEIFRLDLFTSDFLPSTLYKNAPKDSVKSIRWSVNLPLISHNNGILDHAVKEWHELLGLPNSNRDVRPDNELLYQYERDGERVLDFRRKPTGLGDIQLALSYSKPIADGAPMFSARIGAGLPTGHEQNLTGSGRADFFVDTSFELPTVKKLPYLSIHAGLGAQYSGRSGPLKQYLNRHQRYALLTMSVKAREALSIVTQLNYRSPVYKSELPELGAHSVVATFGANFRLAEDNILAIYFSEDIAESTAQDFGVGISWQRQRP